jgi:hypothetical protein
MLFLAFAFTFVIADTFTLDYPDYAKYLIPFVTLVITNDAIYILLGGIKSFQKKNLKRNFYVWTSLWLVCLSLLIIVCVSVIVFSGKMAQHHEVILALAGFGLALLFVAIYDAINLKTLKVDSSIHGSEIDRDLL